MKIMEYIKDKVLLLALHVFCMMLMAGFLFATGYERTYCMLILIFWMLILVLWTGYGYWSRKCYFRELESIVEKMDQRYLLGELMPVSHKLEDRLYKDLIRASNKSVIERIRQIEDKQKDYREYIESWVHEIKAPITGISLMCENYRDQRSKTPGNIDHMIRRIRFENQRIENYVDMTLYYARSDEVYKDYVIRETDLQETAIVVLKRNKQYLIQSQVRAEVDCEDIVYTDQKWIIFILNQLVLNSTKYRKERDACIRIHTEKHGQGVWMIMSDNGIGIKEDELERIFEKGFTGSNGRKTERSTGMGLYLCKKLCGKLGITIRADSKEGKGTDIILEFPVSDYFCNDSTDLDLLP